MQTQLLNSQGSSVRRCRSSQSRRPVCRVLLCQTRPKVDEAEKYQAAADLMVSRIRSIVDDMNRAAKKRAQEAAEAAAEERADFLLRNYSRLKRMAECNSRRRLLDQVEQRRMRGAGQQLTHPARSRQAPSKTPSPVSLQESPKLASASTSASSPLPLTQPTQQSAFEARRAAAKRRLKASREARAAAAAEAARLMSTGDDGRAEAVMEKLLYDRLG